MIWAIESRILWGAGPKRRHNCTQWRAQRYEERESCGLSKETLFGKRLLRSLRSHLFYQTNINLGPELLDIHRRCLEIWWHQCKTFAIVCQFKKHPSLQVLVVLWGLLQRSKFRILCDVYCCTGEIIIPRERELDNFSLATTTLKKHCACNQIIVSQFIVAPTNILIHFYPQFWFLQKNCFVCRFMFWLVSS